MEGLLNSSYGHEFRSSGDWTPIIHPGGALYFCHERKASFSLFWYPVSEIKR